MYPSSAIIGQASEYFNQIPTQVSNTAVRYLQTLTQDDKNAFLELFNGYVNIYMGMEEEIEGEAEFGLMLDFLGYLVLSEYANMNAELTQHELVNLQEIDYETFDEIALTFENRTSSNHQAFDTALEEFYNENIHRGRLMHNNKMRRVERLA